MPSFKAEVNLSPDELSKIIEPYSDKLYWFLSKGYKPHLYQLLFHTLSHSGKLCRFRHIVAGRRGGKTLSASWEVLFYSLFPEVFHKHNRGITNDNPLWIWVLSKNYKLGRPSLLTFRSVLNAAGLTHGREYKEHRGEKYFEFENGSLVEFKTADDPESLRGAGLDILWMDEAAFIPNSDAYKVVFPSLSDKQGQVISTTTPDRMNWFYQEFWSDAAFANPDIGRVEYWSIHNPYFKKEEWESAKAMMHPLIFRREYMAAFDAIEGRELSGEWLNYYDLNDLDHLKDNLGRLKLRTYIGVDPAISLSNQADRFAMSLIGVTYDGSQAYLLEQFVGRIPFPEQLDMIRQWHLKYRPTLIGIESNAYQSALAQQAERMQGLPPIVPIFAKGKKVERILAMAPLFKIGKVLIRADHKDFIDEWLNYDTTVKNPPDDLLDSVEIALRTAGALLPETFTVDHFTPEPNDWADIIKKDIETMSRSALERGIDEHLGGDW